MIIITRTHVEHANALVEEHRCSPDEIAIILELPLEDVTARLMKPCICGTEGCYLVRRAGEKSTHFRARVTSGLNRCTAVAKGKRYGPRKHGRLATAETTRQKIFALTAQGLPRAQVAARLDVSERTVTTYAAPVDERRRVTQTTPPKPRVTDPLLRALQRWRPYCADDASDAAEYPPMLRRTTRAEVVA